MNKLLKKLPSCQVRTRIEKVAGLYREFDMLIDSFQSGNALYCPGECGECCTKFIPYGSTVELDLLALYVLQNSESLFLWNNRVPKSPGCPFFDNKNPFHCRVYPARLFICRAFAFSSFKSKTNEPQYRFCKDFQRQDNTVFINEEIKQRFTPPPPNAVDNHQTIINIEGNVIDINKNITELLDNSLMKIRYFISLNNNIT